VSEGRREWNRSAGRGLCVERFVYDTHDHGCPAVSC